MADDPRRRRLGDDPAADADAAGDGRPRRSTPPPTARRCSTASPTATAPDMLLLDAMMPRKSGIDALRELRAAGTRSPP